MRIKVAIIGAGSILFTRKLMGDILTVPELEETTFSFIEINERNLDMVTQLAERDVKANHKPAKIFATLDRKKGLEDADYVINFPCFFLKRNHIVFRKVVFSQHHY